MQDIDPLDVQRLSQPLRDRGPRVKGKPLGGVPRSESFNGIVGHFGRLRDLRQGVAVRVTEAKLTIELSIDLVTLLVDGAVVATTEHGEIRQRGGAALRPMTEVMALAEADAAAGEAAAPVPVLERPP